MPPSTSRRLLLVHAHPDDEAITTGTTMARYAAEGVHVTVVTCTAGEEGEVIVPELRHLAADREDRLAGVRLAELKDALAALGVDDHRFLGGVGRYRDSGMMGSPANDKPGTFWHADVDEAAGFLVPVIRENRPQVMITYDRNGGYGHPDHIMAHRVAMRAAELAADPGCAPETAPAWEITKIYWTAMPKSLLQQGIDAAKAAAASTGFRTVDTVEELPIGTDDSLVDTRIDGSAHQARKRRAMTAHRTQITMAGDFFALSNGIGMEFVADEYFQIARGKAETSDSGFETDLFSGLQVSGA